jgi:hypothetical protein
MTKAQCTEQGQKALDSLPNKEGWTLKVQDNLGWYWTLYNGPISVYASSLPGHFHCLIAPSVEERGCGAGEWTGNSKKFCTTPWEAIQQEINIVREHIKKERERYNQLEQHFSVI